jgi:hypothetical protein
MAAGNKPQTTHLVKCFIALEIIRAVSGGRRMLNVSSKEQLS